jgi:hypothetical protein
MCGGNARLRVCASRPCDTPISVLGNDESIGQIEFLYRMDQWLLGCKRSAWTMGDFIDIADFPDQLQHRGGGAGSCDDWRPLSLEEVRKQHIQRVLAMCKGNRLRAAGVRNWPDESVPLFERGWIRPERDRTREGRRNPKRVARPQGQQLTTSNSICQA